MRSRPLAAASAALALALFTASCGGEDDPIVTPTSGDITSPSSPIPPTATPEVTGSPAASTPQGSKGTKGSKDTPPERTASGDPLPVVATKNSDLTNFSTALGAAGLAETLGQTGPFTVFAPNNDAFAKLGTRLDALLQPAAKADLVNILSFHVVSGRLRAKDLRDGQLLNTLQGSRVRVSKKGKEITLRNSLGQSSVVAVDVEAGNGIIHVIDTVMTPKTN